MAYQRQWLEPHHIRQHLIDNGLGDFASEADMDKQLFSAVIDGNIRARHAGEILDNTILYKIGKTQWSDTAEYSLPCDIELSAEDVQSLFGIYASFPPVQPDENIAAGSMGGSDIQQFAGVASYVEAEYDARTGEVLPPLPLPIEIQETTKPPNQQAYKLLDKVEKRRQNKVAKKPRYAVDAAAEYLRTLSVLPTNGGQQVLREYKEKTSRTCDPKTFTRAIEVVEAEREHTG